MCVDVYDGSGASCLGASVVTVEVLERRCNFEMQSVLIVVQLDASVVNRLTNNAAMHSCCILTRLYVITAIEPCQSSTTATLCQLRSTSKANGVTMIRV